MGNHILKELKDGILMVKINRPEKKNALTLSMYEDLCVAFAELNKNPDIRVLVLTGVEDSYTSGNDLMDFLQNPPLGPDAPVSLFLQALLDAKKPIIMAVNGLAVGVGTTMLLHADFVYASEDALFSMPFVNLALVPEAGSSKILPDMIGHKRAAELLMLGDNFNVQKAKECGIINNYFSKNHLMEKVREVALKLAAKPPEALRITKELMKADSGSVAEALAKEGKIFNERLSSPEAVEAMTAFMERRPADFRKFK
ncbi:MAG: enoyl-CoA hydratase [Sphingomonadales bacterium]